MEVNILIRSHASLPVRTSAWQSIDKDLLTLLLQIRHFVSLFEGLVLESLLFFAMLSTTVNLSGIPADRTIYIADSSFDVFLRC